MPQPAKGRSLDDIAATLIGGDDALPKKAKPAFTPTVGEEEDLVDEQIEDEVEEEEELDADADEVDEAGDEDQDEADTDEADDDSASDKPILDVEDDDLVEVLIDGNVEYRSLGELKKAMSGEGAIEKRLTEATEMRKATQAERIKWEQQRDTQTASLVQAFNAMHDMVFQPRVSPPSQELRAKNPQQYLLHESAYNKELERLRNMQGQVNQLFGNIQSGIQDAAKDYRQEQSKMLVEKLPVLKDEKLGKKRQQMILEAADHYGFSAQEISLAADHRLFLMAHDAALYRAGQNKGNKEVLETAKTKIKRIPRTIRSGSVAKAKSRAANKRSADDKVKNRAQKSGKVDDITQFILRSK